MRTHVTFQADFSKEAAAEPAGRDLAQYLAAQLGAVGYDVSTPDVHEAYAYRFTCQRAKYSFAVFVALVDDGVLEWLVYAEPTVGVVARGLQKIGVSRAGNTETPQLQELCTAIHKCLQANPRFRSLRWYTAAGWDADTEPDWARSP